jgi:hypothetical protein
MLVLFYLNIPQPSKKNEMDFLIEKYNELIDTFSNSGYEFQSFEEFLINPKEKVVVLRHDVDKKPENALRFAAIQHEKKIKGSYYFRAKPCSWDEKIITEIYALEHEIGYHYENMSDEKGNIERAIKNFEKNLQALRKIVPVNTICMHGSPLSKFDNRELWNKFDFKDYGLIGEPYFNINFNEVLYLTDTGRKWNSNSENIRDKIVSVLNFSFHSTDDIIREIKQDKLPNKIMINFHPQRWHNNSLQWLIELLIQQIKNPLKKLLQFTRNF